MGKSLLDSGHFCSPGVKCFTLKCFKVVVSSLSYYYSFAWWRWLVFVLKKSLYKEVGKIYRQKTILAKA